MAKISDAPVQELLSNPNHGIVSTVDEDGTIHSAVVWVASEGEGVSVNSAKGRKWPTNLERDPRINVLVYDQNNPYEYVEIRGRAGDGDTSDEADRHIDALAKKYLDADSYPFRREGEQRVKFVVQPDVVRHQKQ